jgi:hypothetical protein
MMMLSKNATRRNRARMVVALLWVAGLGVIAAGGEDESGGRAGAGMAARIPAGLDDAYAPLEVGSNPNLDRVDVRDSALESARPGAPAALWEQLAQLDQWQRDNAMIELEPGSAVSADIGDAAEQIANLWNRGAHDAALDELRALEESGAPLNLGIAWTVPLAHGGQRMLDYRIGGTRTDAQTLNLDFDAQSGNIFSVVRWGSTTGTSAWTMNMSADGGTTWSETYAYSSSVGLLDVDCVVADDYVYVAYVAGNATDEARIRRCLASTGGIDNGFGFHVVFDAGAEAVEEVALAANADDYDNRIYYAMIQSDDVLRYAYDVASDGTTFAESSPAGSNPEYGLDMTFDNNRDACTAYLYISFSGNDGDVHVLGRSESDWYDWTIETDVGSFRATAISAYQNTIICAFEYPYSNGTGIRYCISYDCGDSWSPGAIAVPDGVSVFGYFEPDVDARGGTGTAIIYQAEAGEIDPMYYRTRTGFAPGPWTDPTLFSDYDVYTGSDTALGHLPPLGDETFSHGALYLSLDPDFRTPYFDRPGTAGTACGDATPPVIGIGAPMALECACALVDITGSVDDADGTYVGDRLEVRRRGTSAWIEVDAAIGARAGVLYTWDTAGWPQDFYFLRVVGENECGHSASDTTLVYAPTAFDDVELLAPLDAGVYGGAVRVSGTAATQWCFAEYSVSYRLASGGAWSAVDPANPVYTAMVINGALASWDTNALGIPDGDYELRLSGETTCGDAASTTVTVTVDNTPPVAHLDAPANCASVALGASVAIEGEVFDANLGAWTLAVIGGPYADWHTIAGPIGSNATGSLFTWDTSGLPACAYTIRLRATDTAVLDGDPSHHVAEDYVSIVIGAPANADLDGDGDVDMDDFMLFQLLFTGPLP